MLTSFSSREKDGRLRLIFDALCSDEHLSLGDSLLEVNTKDWTVWEFWKFSARTMQNPEWTVGPLVVFRYGWDMCKPDFQLRLLARLEQCKPQLVLFSPDVERCTSDGRCSKFLPELVHLQTKLRQRWIVVATLNK